MDSKIRFHNDLTSRGDTVLIRLWRGLWSGIQEYFVSRAALKYTAGAGSNGRTVWILSYTPVCTEPRVLRQAQALDRAGWRVVVCGLAGRTAVPSYWHFVELPRDIPGLQGGSRIKDIGAFGLMRIARWLGLAAAALGPFHGLRVLGAKAYHAGVPNFRWNRLALQRFAAAHPELRADLVVAHDYFTADAGVALSELFGSKLTVDCHEYARGQYMHDRRWVLTKRPYVRHLQDLYLSRADAVTTVCEGIAELLNREQELKRPVRVVRSVPFFNSQPFRATGERITVMYLGEIFYMRGLHKAIKSMPLWRPEFHFVMQGNLDPRYGKELKRIAAEYGVADRVHFREPVPFNQIVPSANMADIGYFVHKDLSPQKRFVLPNKYFEYVMAGLALCVSDLPEMARLVNQFGFGRLVRGYDERAIADVINSFDRASIDDMKRKSLAAAQELNWDVEQRRMLEFYEEVLA